MTLATVVGTVVASRKSTRGVYRLVSPCKADGSSRGNPLVALDIVGSRNGDMVLVAQGSSCRWSEQTDSVPIDTLIIGIIDAIHRFGTQVYAPGQGERQ